jgi:hypothetical protein
MNIPIKLQLNVNLHNIGRIVFLGCALYFIPIFSSYNLVVRRDASRESLIRSRMPNVTKSATFLSCNTPYDDSRCSVQSAIQSANRNDSKDCLTDFEAMIGHILPLVLFVMQVCLTRELFALSGNYSDILGNILWLITLFIFVIIAIAVHGSTCYNDYASNIISVVGCFLGSFVIVLVVVGGRNRSLEETSIAFKHKKVTTINYDPKILAKVTVI